MDWPIWRLTTSGKFPNDPNVILEWSWLMFEEAHKVLTFIEEAERAPEEPAA